VPGFSDVITGICGKLKPCGMKDGFKGSFPFCLYHPHDFFLLFGKGVMITHGFSLIR
jgi:hypothetical protein